MASDPQDRYYAEYIDVDDDALGQSVASHARANDNHDEKGRFSSGPGGGASHNTITVTALDDGRVQLSGKAGTGIYSKATAKGILAHSVKVMGAVVVDPAGVIVPLPPQVSDRIPAPTAAEPETEKAARVTQSIKNAAHSVGEAGRYGDHKIFIEAAFQKFLETPEGHGMSRPEFHKTLLAAHRRGDLILGRFDLSFAALPGTKMRELAEASSIVDHPAWYHFIVDDQAKRSSAIGGNDELSHPVIPGHRVAPCCDDHAESGRARFVSLARKPVDEWEVNTAALIADKVKAALRKARAHLLDVFKSSDPAKGLKKALKIPGVADINGAFARALKRLYVESKRRETDEIEKLAQARGLILRADDPDDESDTNDGGPGDGSDEPSGGGDEEAPTETAETGSIDDYIEMFGLTDLDDTYTALVTKQRDVFLEALQNGWDIDKLAEELVTSTEPYTDAVVTTIVRTAGTDFFGKARVAAGRESGIVKYYERREIDDERTTEVCNRARGLQLAADRKEVDQVSGALHWNCRGSLTYGTDDNFETDEEQLQDVLSMMDDAFKGE